LSSEAEGKQSRFSKLVVKINNWFRERNERGLVPEEVLLLLPRCIQQSDCVQNVARDIRNCKGCGRCPVKEVVQIVDEYGILAFVAPGGRAALAKVLEDKVKAVVAVACEVELRQGIFSSPKPVIGVVNKRPNGPCFDTQVDLEEVRHALKVLLDKRRCAESN